MKMPNREPLGDENNKSGLMDNRQKEITISRREFVKSLGAGIGCLCLLGVLRPDSVSGASVAAQKAILYDSTKCIGCHICEKACKTVNNLSEKIYEDGELDADTWLKVRDMEIARASDASNKKLIVNRYACMHCGTCVSVCPSGALHMKDGMVLVNRDKCIGCKYCFESCPFDIPRYGKEGTMWKCIFCSERIDNGQIPGCVEACPTRALSFGERDNVLKQGVDRVRALDKDGISGARLYGEKELGGMPLLYVITDPPEAVGFPRSLPQAAVPPITLGDVIAPLGLIAGGLTILGAGAKYIADRKAKQGKIKS